MAIGPDDGDCVIAFLFDLAGEDLWIDLFLLYEHCSGELIDAECAFAVDSEGIWINSLFYTFFFDDDLPFSCIVVDKNSFYLFQKFFCNLCA